MLEKLAFDNFKLTWNINVMYLELFPKYVKIKQFFFFVDDPPLGKQLGKEHFPKNQEKYVQLYLFGKDLAPRLLSH